MRSQEEVMEEAGICFVLSLNTEQLWPPLQPNPNRLASSGRTSEWRAIDLSFWPNACAVTAGYVKAID